MTHKIECQTASVCEWWIRADLLNIVTSHNISIGHNFNCFYFPPLRPIVIITITSLRNLIGLRF